MPNFSPSNLLKAQVALNKKYEAPEMRKKASTALKLGLQNADMLFSDQDELRKREDRPVSAYMTTRTKRATTASRTHNHTGNRGDSVEVPFNWSVFVDKFSISLKQLDNNVIAWQQAFQNLLENAFINIHESAETAFITYLLAQRTQVNSANQGGTFNAANDAFEITLANQNRFLQFAKSMMKQNNYSGSFDLIADNLLYANLEYFANQGTSNATNLGFQFSGVNIGESNDLSDPNYANGVGLLMPSGQFGVIPWIPKQNRQGSGDYNSFVGGFGTMTDPFGTGLEFAVHGYSQRADASAANGDTQDVVMEFEVSIDLAPKVAPLSQAANETIVYEVAQLAA